MGLQRNHVQGKHQYFYTRQEATPGTLLRGRAADGVKVISSTITLTEEPTPRRDIQVGRQEYEHIDGPTTVEVTGESYVIPSGTVGIPPDCDQLLRAALGESRVRLTVNAYLSGAGDTVTLIHDDGTTVTTVTLTEGVGFNAATSNTQTATNIASAFTGSSLGASGAISAGASGANVNIVSTTGSLTISSGDVAAWSPSRVEYGLRDTQQLKTLTVSRVHHNGNTTSPVAIAREDVTGVHVNELGFSGSGSEPPRMTFSGKGRAHIFTGTAELEGTIVNSGTAVTVAGQGANFEADSLIKVGTDDNAGAGFVVTAVSTDTITATPASMDGVDGVAIVPHYVAPTTVGSPIAGTVGSCTIDGTTYPIVSYEISINNNYIAIEDEAFSERMTDAVPQYREITGTITVRARADLIAEIGRRKAKGDRTIIVTMGSVAGRICTILLPQVRFPPSGMNVPFEGLSDIPLAFRALDSAEGAADALVVRFT